MKNNIFCLAVAFLLFSVTIFAQQRGYHDAPYTRYEAENGSGAGTSITNYAQNNIAYEASGRTCVYLSNGQSKEWTASAAFRGIVVRASGASSQTATSGTNVSAKLYINNAEVATLTFDASYGWKNLQTDNNQNYTNVTNGNPRMRYDEQRYLHSSSVTGTIKIVSQGNLYLDFIEIEDVPDAIACPAGYTAFTGDNLKSFIENTANPYIPAGNYTCNNYIDAGTGSKIIRGAGKWYTNITFSGNQAGFVGHSTNCGIKDMYLNCTNKSRSSSNKGIRGVWGSVSDMWVEHFECGAWIGNYDGGYGSANADGMTVTNCRFRSNYADGINLCRGSVNCTVSHSNFRNNGDDDMAVWPADNMACNNNTFEYNTAEHCWFASSCALYGGSGNKWKNIIVRDNYETGIRVNGKFTGTCFADGTTHEFSNIDVIRCGTWRDAYGGVLAAVDITTASSCNNVRKINFTCINIENSNADAIFFRNQSGSQISNVTMNGITINGTSKRGYTENSNWGNAVGIRFVDGPTINNVTFCGSFSGVEGDNVAPYGMPSGWTASTSGCTTCTTTPTITITGVTMSGCSGGDLESGQTRQLSASVQGTGGTIPQTVTWTSNNTNVATVSTSGLVTAGNTAGTATITATSTADNTKKATCSITVVVPTVSVTSVSISNASVYINENITVPVTFNPANATNKNVTFSITSGADKLLLVNSATGEFKGLAAGSANIKVTSADGNKTATAVITVNSRAVTNIAVTPSSTTISVSNTTTLTAEITPSNATNTNVTWSIQSGNTYASVNASGVVTGLAAGTATVRATAQDGSGVYGEATINVTTCTATGEVDLIVEDFSWSPANPQPNDHVVFTATVKNNGGTAIPAGAKLGLLFRIGSCTTGYVQNSNTFVWSDQNKGDNGLPVAIPPCGIITLTINGGDSGNAFWTAGTANDYTVCAEVDDGNLITESNENNNTLTKTVTVSNVVAVSDVTISPKTQTVTAGAQVTFSATVAPSNATNQNVTYSIVSGGTSGTLNGNVLTTTSAGTITVRATSAADATKYDDATITVNPAPAISSVSVTPATASVQQGNTQQFSANVTAVGGASTAVTWSVSGNNSAGTTISTGGLLTVAAGETATTITVTATSTFDTGKKGNATVTVSTTPLITGVSIQNCPSGNLETESQVTLSATVQGTGAFSQTVTWESSNTSVASVNNGVVTALAAGSATITAKSTADNSKSATCTINIMDPVGLDEIENNGKSIISYKNIVEIRGVAVGEKVSIYNLLGVKIFSATITQNPEIIASLKQGAYIIMIDGTSLVKKILILE
ncbi:MAG: Ig-like domain-containing protein [Prevotellaceae bacterium]|jgi:uncharacterized protein YjdB|nr:Ig-like domain-containing protein [Prevotellaceae bacterium]